MCLLRAILRFVWIPRIANEKEGETKRQLLPFLIPINPAPVYKIKEEAARCNRVLKRDLCHASIRPARSVPLMGKPAE